MRKIKWGVCLISLVIFSLIAYLVINNLTVSFDSSIYNLVHSNNNSLNGFYKFITSFASEIMILFISVIFLIFKNKRYGFFVILNAILIWGLNVFLKLIFMRDRPYDLMIINESGYSFPSGHAMAALGFYGFIIYLLWQFNLEKKVKYIFSALLGFLIILIGISRIYLGVHYASDVIAGYLISLAYLIIYITYTQKHLEKR